jgi:glutamyl-tRNA synthetase
MSDGRFAPSPTGELHLGNLRTALLAWLFARTARSRFLVRMEDLDEGSVRPEHRDAQLRDLEAIGIDWDGPVVHQRDRLDLYEDAIAQLQREGLTYPCYCTRREIQEAAAAPQGPLPEGAYPGTCRDLSAAARADREAAGRPPALRIRSGDARVAFVDRVHGRFEGIVDDVVIRRNDGTPAYNLAVVVDDVAQGIGEVVRGDDLLASTPRQLHLAALLHLTPPSYAHVPLVLGPGGQRLAKRDGAVTLADRRARGDDAADVVGWLLASAGLIPSRAPVSPAALHDLVQTVDLTTLVTTPWQLDPADLA